jgi:hypothetical protein
MSTNLPANPNGNKTTEFFDVYNTDRNSTVVNPNEFDAIMGFFKRKTNDNVTISTGLTDTVLQIAMLHNVSPMDIIEDFNDYGVTEIQQALVSLINQTRANTSILGFNRNKAPSQVVARNILD